jgi:hypothetical protein
MKKSAVLFLIIIFALSIKTVLAKAGSDSLDNSQNLQTFNLYLINGYAISYEFNKVNHSLFRVEFDFAGNSSNNDLNGDRTSIYTNPPENTKAPYSEKSNYSNLSLSLSLHYIYKFAETNFAAAYLGGGPIFSYSKGTTKSESSNIYSDSTSYKSSYNNNTINYSLGITFVLGLKTFLTKNISIFAESYITGGKRWTREEFANENVTDYPSINDYYYKSFGTSSGGGWFYNSEFIRVGLSLSI